jgi:hypothetical protein
MGRAVAPGIRGNRRGLTKTPLVTAVVRARSNVSLNPGLEMSTCYWYQSQSWVRTSKRP